MCEILTKMYAKIRAKRGMQNIEFRIDRWYFINRSLSPKRYKGQSISGKRAEVTPAIVPHLPTALFKPAFAITAPARQ